MNRKSNLLISLLFGYFVSFISAVQKIMHYQFSSSFFMIGMICAIIFIISAIIEIRQSTRITKNEKTMWTLGLIFMWGITAIIYFQPEKELFK